MEGDFKRGRGIGSPPSCQNVRRGAGRWQEAPLSHISSKGGWAGDSKPLHLVFRVREGLWLCWGMGGDIWQERGQEFNAMAR